MKLDKRNVEDILGLTPLQEGLLFSYIHKAEKKEYIEQFALHIHGALDLKAFKNAWGAVIETNEILRAVYQWENVNQPLQIILKKAEMDLRIVDWSTEGQLNHEKFEDLRIKDRNEYFDLHRTPFRVTLCIWSKTLCTLLISNHHILFDGWSRLLILKEFGAQYRNYLTKKSRVKIHKTKFSEFYRETLKDDTKALLTLWTNNLKDYKPVFGLPSEKQSERSDVGRIKMKMKLDANWASFLSQNHLTPASFFYSAIGIVLQKYNDLYDVVIGTVTSGRGRALAGIEEMIGLFISTLPLRIRNLPDSTLIDIIKNVQSSMHGEEYQQSISISEINKVIGAANNETLFNVLVAIENYSVDNTVFDQTGLSVERYEAFVETPYDLTLLISLEDEIAVEFVYNATLFNDGILKNILLHVEKAAEAMTNNPLQKVCQLDILSVSERKKLDSFNTEVKDYPKGQTIHDNFSAISRVYPDRVALVSESEHFSFLFLEQEGTLAAQTLIQSGAKPEEIIALFFSSGADMIIANIAALKCQACVLLIDPHQVPAERIQFMLTDSHVKIIVAQKKYVPMAKAMNLNVNVFTVREMVKPEYHNVSPVFDLDTTALAYVIYTSGTTGNPKGVLLEHRNILRVVRDTNYLDSWSDKRFLLTSALGFDVTFIGIWGMLLNGGVLFLKPQESVLSNSLLSEILFKNRINLAWFTASWFNQLVDEAPELFRPISDLLIGGEALSPKHVEKVKMLYPSMNVINGYGPTENGVFSTTFNIGAITGPIPIGYPIANSTAFVLDNSLRPLPIGIIGELFVGGNGVARGYLNQPELTAQKFVVLKNDTSSSRLYKTGDFARWSFSGYLEYFGRVDGQVKIRGNRVEILEVENRIKSFKGIANAYVLCKTNASGEKVICAYLKWNDGSDYPALRMFLSAYLSEASLPTWYLDVDSFPLTPNGKIDLKSLPDPFALDNAEVLPPVTPVEEMLQSVWAELLKLEANRIGRNSVFFQMGGHSLTALRMMSRINKKFHVELKISDIFEYPVLEQLACKIDSLKKRPLLPPNPALRQDRYPASSSQKQLYVLQNLNPESVAYNMPYVAELSGLLDLGRFNQALTNLIERHECLRASFELVQDEVFQKISDQASFELAWIEADGRDEAIRSFISPFDLGAAPIMRVGLWKKSESYLLVFDSHHIITDKPSQDTLIKDFISFYTGATLPPVTIRYRDVIISDEKKSGTEKINTYWQNEFSGELPSLNLPCDFVRPQVNHYTGARLKKQLSATTGQRLIDLAREHNSTLYNVLLSCYCILLSKLSGQEDIIVGTPVDSRYKEEMIDVVGMFVNTLPIRNRVDSRKTFRDFAEEVRNKCIGFLLNQNMNYDEFLHYVKTERDVTRNIVFDAVMAFETWDNSGFNFGDLRVRTLQDFDPGISKFDLTLNINYYNEKWTLTFEYSTQLFKKETIERFFSHLENIINFVAVNPDKTIGEIEMISSEESLFLREECNATTTQFSSTSAHIQFDNQAFISPHHVAAVFQDSYVTYDYLRSASDSLASAIHRRSKLVHSVIGITADRSIQFLIGVFGILKSGNGYVPLDSSLPPDRVSYILKDSNVSLIIGDPGRYASADSLQPIGSYGSDDESKTIADGVTEDDLAYVLFTSGSTGMPKGVMIEHKSLTNIVDAVDGLYPVQEGDGYLFKSPASFDFSIAEIFAPLLKGGKVVVLGEGEQRDAEATLKAVHLHKISHLTFVPSMFNAFMEYLGVADNKRIASLKYIFLGGEAVSFDLVNKFNSLSTAIALENMYGPTEATVYATKASLNAPADGKTIPIGRPLANYGVLSLSDQKKVQPVGVEGELFIWGRGVGRGYLNRPELTAQKFIKHPYDSSLIGYLTGDRGYAGNNKKFYYSGRADSQVKVRGFRIELGEIEESLKMVASIQEAVAVFDRNFSRLAVFFKASVPLTYDKLKTYLNGILPHYMVPEIYVQVDSFQKTISGKIDRAYLLTQIPEHHNEETEAPTPRTELQELILGIWKDILGVENAGIRESFFFLGGDSIKALQVIARLNRSGLKVSMRNFLLNPTIADLAEKLTESNAPSTPLLLDSCVPLGPIQQWFFQLQKEEVNHFNQGILLALDKSISLKDIQEGLKEITIHHDLLRSVFRQHEGRWIQSIVQENSFKIREHALVLPLEEDTEYAKIIEELHADVNISQGPLVKAAWITDPERCYLVIIIHHLVVDAVSWYILLDDLDQLLSQRKKGLTAVLPVQSDSYAKWVHDLTTYSMSKAFLPEKKFWIETDSTACDVIVPKSANGMSGKWKDSTVNVISFDEKITSALLTDANKAYSTTISELLLAALSRSVQQTFQCSRIPVMMEGHGREELAGMDISVSRTLGWFTSLYPIIFTALTPFDWSSQIVNVKEKIRRVPNKGMGYGILKYLVPDESKKEFQEQLKPQILFNYLGNVKAKSHQQSFDVISTSPGKAVGDLILRSHSLEITGSIWNNHLEISFGYDLNLSKNIKGLIEHFKNSVRELVSHCLSIKTVIRTPFDFTYKDMSPESLSQLNERFDGELEDIYPLTSTQQGILFHSLFENNTAYFSQLSYRIEGELKFESVQRSLTTVFLHHPILRGFFVYKELKQPVQVIVKGQTPPIVFYDISKIEGNQKDAVEDFRSKDRDTGFNLDQDPLIRVAVLKLNEKSFELIWSFHHLIIDGWSLGIVCSEFLKLYAGGIPALEPSQQWSKYLNWIRSYSIEESRNFWKNHLTGWEKSTPIKPRSDGQQSGIEKRGRFENEFVLSEQLTNKLSDVAKQSGTSLSTLVEAAWAVLLGRYNNVSDVVFGTVVSGRPAELPGMETTVGLFINTIPVRIAFEDSESFSRLLQRIHRMKAEVGPFHYDALVEIQRQQGINSLFDHIIVFENYPLEQHVKDLLKTEGKEKYGFSIPEVHISEHNNYEFSVTVIPGKELGFRLKYSSIFSKNYVDHIAEHLQNILFQVSENGDVRTGQIELFGIEEKMSHIYSFNKRQTGHDQNKTMVDLFQDQLHKSPDAIAIVSADIQMSYQELSDRADAVAFFLWEKGIRVNDIVALLMSPGPEAAVSIWGVLKAGAAYLPVDMNFPSDRINYMLADSAVKIMLTDKVDNGNLAGVEIEAVEVTSILKRSLPSKNTVIPGVKDMRNVYVIYTSGSTGKPKGVVISHRNLSNYSRWLVKELVLTTDDSSILTSSYAFDLGYSALFPFFISGGIVHLVKSEIYLLPERFLHYLRKSKASVLKMTPGMFSSVIHCSLLETCNLNSIRWILLGGEQIVPRDMRKALKINNGITFMNHYGPTESTIGCIFHRIDSSMIDSYAQEVTIGNPIDNMQAYVLDRQKKPLPYYATGELYLSGEGVAAGYLNNPELSVQKFIDHPYLPNKKIYKTGDLAYRTVDGKIAYLGRSDNQVKIRGYRVELDEIKNTILEYSSVSDTVLIMKDVGVSDMQLICYLVGNSLNEKDIRQFLSLRLPHYMMPAYFVFMAAIPKTGNGKVDITALPHLSLKHEKQVPLEGLSLQLAEVWAEILDVETSIINLNSDFFALGGHSLKAMMLGHFVYKLFQLTLPISQIYDKPLLGEMTSLIAKLYKQPAAPVLSRIPNAAHYRLSQEQERLYVAQQLDPASTLYNIPYAVRIDGSPDLEKYNSAFQKLANRHEGLRTSIKLINGEPKQIVHEDLNFKVNYIDATGESMDFIFDRTILPFRLEDAPLWRATIVKSSHSSHVLVVDVHHIISDGVSNRTLIQEFVDLYEDKTLDPVMFHYKDYAEWQQLGSVNQWIMQQELIYRENLRPPLPLLSLPVDHQESVKTTSGIRISFRLPEESHCFSERIAEEEGVTLQSFWLTIYYYFLARISKQNDIVIYNTCHGRHQLQLHNIVGFFVKILPLRYQVDKKQSFKETLKEVNQILIKSYDFQMCRLEMLEKNDPASRRFANSSLHAVYDYQKTKAIPLVIGGIKMQTVEHNFNKSPFPLMFQVVEGETTSLAFTYQNALFEQDTISGFIGTISSIITSLMDDGHLDEGETDNDLEYIEPNKIEFNF